MHIYKKNKGKENAPPWQLLLHILTQQDWPFVDHHKALSLPISMPMLPVAHDTNESLPPSNEWYHINL
jgi:hypothetical protein